MIKKLEIMISATGTHSGDYPHAHYGSQAEPNVSVLDVANKLNEIIDYINTKESNATK